MATVITSECINCGACEPECPNTAIYAGGVDWELNGAKHPALAADIFYIVPDKCTECVGFFDREACAVVCPVDCCIPDPQRPETEDVLMARARQLHPDQTFPDAFPSRFRQTGAATPSPPPAPAAAQPPSATEPPASATPPVVEPTVSAPPPASPEPPVPSAAAVAPAPTPPPEPVAQPQARPKPPPAPPKERPAPAAAAEPAAEAAAQTVQPDVPPLDTFEIPIDCFRCGHQYTVPFKHFRTGIVHFCPACHGSFVVTRSAHGHVHDAAHRVYAELCREVEVSAARSAEARQALAERVRGRLDAFADELRQSTKQFRPPGAPRKRAGIFG